jgi:cyclic pyranopterin phosphate synthase
MPSEGISKFPHGHIQSFETYAYIVDVFARLGVNKIRITGGEPLVRKGVFKLIEHIGKMDDITDFAMTTNGLLLRDQAKALKEAGLDRVNVSLDSLKPERYREMTRGGDLKSVLEGIEEAKKWGLTPIKINVVLIGGFNEDEIVDFVQLTQDEAIDVRFIELMPIGEVSTWSVDRFIPNESVLKHVPALKREPAKDPASPAVYYRLPNGKGRVGLISPISCSFCSACNRVRLTSEGKLKYCLHDNDEIDLAALIAEGQDLEKVIEDVIKRKPKSHQIESGNYVIRNMFQVGG